MYAGRAKNKKEKTRKEEQNRKEKKEKRAWRVLSRGGCNAEMVHPMPILLYFMLLRSCALI